MIRTSPPTCATFSVTLCLRPMGEKRIPCLEEETSESRSCECCLNRTSFATFTRLFDSGLVRKRCSSESLLAVFNGFTWLPVAALFASCKFKFGVFSIFFSTILEGVVVSVVRFALCKHFCPMADYRQSAVGWSITTGKGCYSSVELSTRVVNG